MIKPSWFSETMGSFCLILAQPPIWRGRLAADYWQQLGQRIRQQGGRLLGIWGEHQYTAGANIKKNLKKKKITKTLKKTRKP
jgi:hypothetical protein